MFIVDGHLIFLVDYNQPRRTRRAQRNTVALVLFIVGQNLLPWKKFPQLNASEWHRVVGIKKAIQDFSRLHSEVKRRQECSK